jgi:dipeptidyl aminopeptidase/acylaminoacyl peptidase
MAAISKVEYGDPDTQAQMLHDLSPINKLDRVKTPLIVLHGENDTNVPVVEAEQIVSRLKARGGMVELIMMPGEGHGFRRLPNRIRSTEATSAFFAKYLLGAGA